MCTGAPIKTTYFFIWYCGNFSVYSNLFFKKARAISQRNVITNIATDSWGRFKNESEVLQMQ